MDSETTSGGIDEGARPLKPNRYRRRILLAAIAVVGILSAWWYWPRGDERFVGTWRGKDARLVNPITLRRHGQGEFQISGYRLVFPWHVEGEWLVIGWDAPQPISDVVAHLSGLTRRHLGFEMLTKQFRYRIVEQTHDRLHLTEGRDSSATQYVRAPE
jgi:hypothetical protein